MIWVVVPFSRPGNRRWVRHMLVHQTRKPAGVVIVENGASCGSWGYGDEFVTRSESHQSDARNVGMDLASRLGADAIAFWDDDDYYGPRYLEEAEKELECGHKVIGKAVHFIWMEQAGRLLFHTACSKENDSVDAVPGGSIVSKVWDSMPLFERMPWGEDTRWCDVVRQSGVMIHGTSRHNFARVRHSGAHAYPLSDEQTEGMALEFGEVFDVSAFGEVDTPGKGQYRRLERGNFDPFSEGGLFDTMKRAAGGRRHG